MHIKGGLNRILIDYFELLQIMKLFGEEVSHQLLPRLNSETESAQKLQLIQIDVKYPLIQMNLIRSTTINQGEQDFCRRHFGMQVRQLIIIPIPSESQI